MSAGDETSTQWKLDLDIADALDSVNEFSDALEKAGDGDSISGLLETFTEVGAAVGAVGIAVFAVKEAFDVVFDAEKIQAVQLQFDLLSKNAGLFGDNLKEALVESAGGLVGETDLLQGANKAIVQMGDAAGRLPELMTLARQTTMVMGGDLMTNFNAITQAIASGNTHMLKRLGISVDVTKAEKEYADEMGVSVEELDQAAKSHAVLNAVLEQSQAKLAGTKATAGEATTAWQTMKVSFQEMGEAFTTFFGGVFGPAVTKAINLLKGFADNVKSVALSWFGNESQKAAEKVKGLHSTVEDATKQVAFYQQALEHPTKFQSAESLQKALDNQKNRLDEASKQLEKYEKKKSADSTESAAVVEKNLATEDKARILASDAHLKAEQKLKDELDKMRQQSLAEELKATQSEQRVDEIAAEQRVAIEKTMADQRAKIIKETVGHAAAQNALLVELDKKKEAQLVALVEGTAKKKDDLLKTELAQARTAEDVDNVIERQKQAVINQTTAERTRAISQYGGNEKRLAAELVAIEARKVQQIKALDDNARKQEDAADAKYVQDAENNAQGIARAFSTAASQAKKNIVDMSDVGTSAFNALGTSATAMFSAIGNGSQSASKALANAFLGAIGQIATSKGSMVIASGIADLAMLNPIGTAEIAAGGALVALGSALSALGGSSSPAPASSSGASASAGSSTSTASQQTPSSPTNQTQTPQQTVSLTIAGNYYDSNQTKQELMGMIRSATDATDFNYVKAGGK